MPSCPSQKSVCARVYVCMCVLHIHGTVTNLNFHQPWMGVVLHTLAQRHCVYLNKFANLIYEEPDLVVLICISCKLMNEDERRFRCVKCICVSCFVDWQFNFLFIVHFSIGLLAFLSDLYMFVHACYLYSKEISPYACCICCKFFSLFFICLLNLFYFPVLDIKNL